MKHAIPGYFQTPEEIAMCSHRQMGKSRASTWHCKRDVLHPHLLYMQSVVCIAGDLVSLLGADIEPDLKVRAAMNEINAAQRLRRAGRQAIVELF